MNSYVAASYGVVLFALVMYVVVVGLRAARQAREAELLALLVERRAGAAPAETVPAEAERAVDAPARAARP